MTSFAAGLLFGVAGSIHCAGMCGPLLVTVNRFGAVTRCHAYARMLTYHGARVLMYATLGLAAGYTGSAVATAGLGRAIAIVSGVLLIAAAIGALPGRRLKWLSAVWSSMVIRIVEARGIVRARPFVGHIVLGVANGLLPCGLVYAALAASTALGTVVDSLLFMSGFGLGTVPILMGLVLSAIELPFLLKRRLRFAAPLVMALAGTLLIARAIVPSEPAPHSHGGHPILSFRR
ncbi:MAG TPA: sulfite exporter TauE/SafE family protein [Vicinamibacterales bacterium]|nr:sulfite exporter TauE/SafE family protein [Vicinamibacterales bacterium]